MENDIIPILLNDEGTYFNLLEFLGKSSMESVDNSILSNGKYKRETFRGKVTRLVKNTLEKEIYLKEKSLCEIDTCKVRNKFLVNF